MSAGKFLENKAKYILAPTATANKISLFLNLLGFISSLNNQKIALRCEVKNFEKFRKAARKENVQLSYLLVLPAPLSRVLYSS